MLRPYQTSAIDAIRAAIKAGKRRVICVAPTGSGKSVLAAYGMAKPAVERGRHVLVLAHRTELVKQLADKMPPGLVGIIKAGFKPTPNAPIQVASVQTITRRGQFPPAEVVITDECHHATAATYRRIYELYPDAVHCGFTATPYQPNGCGLGTDFWQAIIPVSSVPELTQQGFLVPVRTYAPSRVSLDGVHTRAGEFDSNELSARVAPLVGDVVKHYAHLAAGRPAMCFAVNVEHSKRLAEQFTAAGIKAEHVDGVTDPEIRAAALARLASGETMVLCNCALFTEGTDCPPVSCVILARPTKSRVLWRQQVGRGMRPYPGKVDCILLDHANCSEMHGLISDVETYTLADDRRTKAGDAGPPIKTCPACFAVILSSCAVCGECGAAQPAARTAEIQTADGELKELAQAVRRDVRFCMAESAALVELAEKARAKGYAPGWIGYQFSKRFGRWPCGTPQLKRLLEGDAS